MSVEFTPERAAELSARVEARRDAGQLVEDHGAKAPAVALSRAEIADGMGASEIAHWQLVAIYTDKLLRQRAALHANDNPVCDGLELMRAFHEISDPLARGFVVDIARLFAVG